MSLRRKYAGISAGAILVASLSMYIIGQVSWHGYVLLPFVVLAGLTIFVAIAAFINMLFPKYDLVEDSLTNMVLDLFIGFLRH